MAFESIVHLKALDKKTGYKATNIQCILGAKEHVTQEKVENLSVFLMST